VLAPPAGAAEPIPTNQLLDGDIAAAPGRLRAGGWAILSEALAAEHGLHLGERFLLPSPVPTPLRVAALITNLGWPPGVVILNNADFLRAWGSEDISAYAVMLIPGASAGAVAGEIRRTLGPDSGLVVQSGRAREQEAQAESRQGLARLTGISLLVLIAGVLAIATSFGAAVWQRRSRFAKMKVQGYGARMLWEALLWESALLLGVGCLMGALFGIYGELLLSHALQSVTGFPVVVSAQALIALVSFVVITAVAAAVVAIPGYRAANVHPSVR
jgi:putative ABC transport system permease protein